MKEKPILFSAPMVRAILEGRKTQTRRIVKPQPRNDQIMPRDWSDVMRHNPDAIHGDGLGWGALDVNGNYHEFRCPHGQPKDRLWVRETFRAQGFCDYGIQYRADLFTRNDSRAEVAYGTMNRWRPSIHMPRWASRITLEIVSVRMERLREISRKDAKQEGFWPSQLNGLESWAGKLYGNAQLAFEACWKSIYTKEGQTWNDNPWVWVIEFKRIEP